MNEKRRKYTVNTHLISIKLAKNAVLTLRMWRQATLQRGIDDKIARSETVTSDGRPISIHTRAFDAHSPQLSKRIVR